MKNRIAGALLAGALLAMPVMPVGSVQAAPLSDAELNCLVFPMLKKECWEMGAERASAATAAVAATAESTASAVEVPLRWWDCTAAASGSGHLFDC